MMDCDSAQIGQNIWDIFEKKIPYLEFVVSAMDNAVGHSLVASWNSPVGFDPLQ